MSDLSGEGLAEIYRARFSGQGAYRAKVWGVLVTDLFARWIPAEARVLDLGCGHGEFINAVSASQRFAMDLNPDVPERLDPAVRFFRQSCSARWPLADASLDTVFSSNFFEHLPDKNSCLATWREAYRCLRPGGRLIALGPNIALLNGRYWDFFDHHVPLSERSLVEGLKLVGFIPEVVYRCALPYTMSQGPRYPSWILRLYLRLRVVWPIFGRQFLVVVGKPVNRVR